MPGPRTTVDAMTDRRLAVAAWESLFRAQHEVLREISDDFGEDDLTQAEYDVLLTVVRGDDNAARLRDVTANMLISQPSVSRLVDRMVARDLISKCTDPHDGRGAIVRATDKGVVISITDRMDFGMFKIGSALPNRDLVLAMDKIGRIVNGQKGKITIKGHTDARPFRSENYDNWRLSTARAQSAYYMLVRGGVDERRIVEVAGFADRQPKDAADPLAAVNRRIEIFLETGG